MLLLQNMKKEKEIYYFYVGQILPESCEESSLKMKRTLSEVTLKNRSNTRPLPYGRHTRRFFDLIFIFLNLHSQQALTSPTIS